MRPSISPPVIIWPFSWDQLKVLLRLLISRPSIIWTDRLTFLLGSRDNSSGITWRSSVVNWQSFWDLLKGFLISTNIPSGTNENPGYEGQFFQACSAVLPRSASDPTLVISFLLTFSSDQTDSPLTASDWLTMCNNFNDQNSPHENLTVSQDQQEAVLGWTVNTLRIG